MSNQFVTSKTTTSIAEPHSLAYSALVDAAREHDGTLTFQISATGIVIKRGRCFPFTGRGYAWVQTMIGECGEELIDI